jgi:sporulation protein YlmC with PRC-barrel domain
MKARSFDALLEAKREDTMLKHFSLMVACALAAGTVVAQTSSPPTPAPAPAPAINEKAVSNLAGQGKWRASKVIGVDIYGPDDKKVGDVTEILLDKNGKIEMITVGVGGFLGIGSKDVAIPFADVDWSDQPLQVANSPPPSTLTTPPAPSGAASPPPPSVATARAPQMYPDHGKISHTKEQLTSAPAVTYVAP